MKKIIIIILVAISTVLATCIIINVCRKDRTDYALSNKTINNYTIGNDERRISQVLYFNRDNIYNNYNIVNSISFVDEDSGSILKLKINNIKKTGYTHKYKGIKYYSYVYDLSIPTIGVNMYFNNCNLEIVSEDNTLSVPIVLVSIKDDEFNDSNKPILVNSLEGLCAYEPYQSLSKVKMTLENKTNNNITITSMNMGNMVDLVKEDSETLIFNSNNTTINETIIGYMDKELEVSLSYKARYILKESYIEINYTDDFGEHTTYIDTFNYYDNGYTLPESDDLINTLKFKV